ncbi:MAG: hypothetical protein U1F43_00805 [Myxococcota bacterium]
MDGEWKSIGSAGAARGEAVEARAFVRSAWCLEPLLHQRAAAPDRDRLGDEVVGARAHGLDCRVDRRHGRDHDHRRVGVQRAQLGQERQPRGRPEPQVEQHQVDRDGARQGDGRLVRVG